MNTAIRLLATLRGQGITLAAEGPQIRITAAGRPSAELRGQIRRHKAELLAALEATHRAAALDAMDLYELWQERCAIWFYDGQLPWK
jgi:antitoxin (DNA-binding transcriptional repressor) of toxin-antitoxin stability system